MSQFLIYLLLGMELKSRNVDNVPSTVVNNFSQLLTKSSINFWGTIGQFFQNINYLLRAGPVYF
jgi:hypothetical protein